MNNKIRLILFLIVLLGAFLRIYRLAEVPVGFHIDEAQVGYNAYSLWKTGRDETGRFLPSHLKIWDFERPLGIAYLTIPGIMIFGLNEFGTRIDTAFIGILSIIIVFLLTRELFNNKSLSLLTAFFFAISPWHIILSRATSDAVVSLFFYLLGTWFAIRYYRKNIFIDIVFTYLFFVGSFFSYYSTRITIPFLLFFFFLFSLRSKTKIAITFFVCLILYIIFPFLTYWGASASRFNQVSVFHEQGTKLLLEEQIREDGSNSPIILTRLFHNKPVNFSLGFFKNLTSYLTPGFLIFEGGVPNRYIIPDMGMIYYWEIFLLLVGGMYILRFTSSKSFKLYIFILFWFVMGVFAASLTKEDTPNVQRALFILPAYQWICAMGILYVYSIIRKYKYILMLFLSIFIIWNFSYFFHQYTVHTFMHKPWYRQYEMKELVYYLTSAQDKYKKTIITFNSTEPYIFFLFFNKTDPRTYQNLITKKGLSYVWNTINKIKISREDCPPTLKKERENLLVVYKIQCYIPNNSRVVKKIKTTDGNTILIAVDFPKNYKYRDQGINYEDELK